MVRWICGVKPNDNATTDSLYIKLGIQEVAIALRTKGGLTMLLVKIVPTPLWTWIFQAPVCVEDLENRGLIASRPILVYVVWAIAFHITGTDGELVLDVQAACSLPQYLGHPQQMTNKLRILYYLLYYLHNCIVKCLCGGCKMSPVLHHCVVIFFWSFGIMDLCCLHLKIESRSCARWRQWNDFFISIDEQPQ